MASYGRLARSGFLEPARAARLLTELGLWDAVASEPTTPQAERLISDLASAASPDVALRSLANVKPSLLERLKQDTFLWQRLLPLLGCSAVLGEFAVNDVQTWDCLTEANFAGVPSLQQCRQAFEQIGPLSDPIPVLRSTYRRLLVCIAVADLTGEADYTTVTRALSQLAEATLDAALTIAQSRCGAEVREIPQLAIIAMGKCGGQELNYLSDVDVLFVAEPVDKDSVSAGLELATRLARDVMAICAAVAWPVDANLRPEGKDGPLVRTLASYEKYYDNWARIWEFQALLKARFVAGNASLGHQWEQRIVARVWQAADRPGVVDEVRHMRQRVLRQLAPQGADRQLKLGRGGLRDIEFAVQLLQLVHGRGDSTLRDSATVGALRSLTAGGYVGRVDGEMLIDSYRFLRTIEHRLQLQQLRRVQSIPTNPVALEWLARSLGFRAAGSMSAAQAFEQQWRTHQTKVRELHEKLFYRPLLTAAAAVPGEALRMSSAAAAERLATLGFVDARTALRHIEALTTGVSRRAAVQRALLPAILSELADAPSPDESLLAYRNVCERLGATPWFLRLLRDEGITALRLAHVVSLSRYIAELIGRNPEGVRLLVNDTELEPLPSARIAAAAHAASERHADPGEAANAVRRVRARELTRLACADLLGLASVETIGIALAEVNDITLDAVLAVALRETMGSLGPSVLAEPPIRMAIIGLGRLGGREVSYGSDVDVVFVYEPVHSTTEQATTTEHARLATVVAERVRSLLSAPGPAPGLVVDAGLRPEGRQGPLVRSFSAYVEYYRRWSQVWEAQALLRARPVAGDIALGGRFMRLIDPIRYPAEGLNSASIREIRRIKARMDSERLPRGADPATHLKLGRGGLVDVEWAVQVTQLAYAHKYPALQTTATLLALTAAHQAELISATDELALATSWKLASKLRNAIMVVRGRASDQLPRRGQELATVMRVLGEPAEREPGDFLDEYFRIMRRGHQAAVRVFNQAAG